MTQLKNCAFPNDCQCAARGYEHETDECVVPRVIVASRTLGVAPDGLPRRVWPKPVATSGTGTAIPLAMSDDFSQDILDAIEVSGSRKICTFAKNELDLIVRRDRYDRSIILHTFSEKMGSTTVLSWLIVLQLREGDCLAWMTAIPNPGVGPFFTATLAEREELFSLLRAVAGVEGDGNQESSASPIPTEEEIEFSLKYSD